MDSNSLSRISVRFLKVYLRVDLLRHAHTQLVAINNLESKKPCQVPASEKRERFWGWAFYRGLTSVVWVHLSEQLQCLLVCQSLVNQHTRWRKAGVIYNCLICLHTEAGIWKHTVEKSSDLSSHWLRRAHCRKHCRLPIQESHYSWIWRRQCYLTRCAFTLSFAVEREELCFAFSQINQFSSVKLFLSIAFRVVWVQDGPVWLQRCQGSRKGLNITHHGTIVF